MSVESDIIAAVSSIAPCSANTYTGTATTYFVIYADTIPANFANDEPRSERFLIQLHFFCPITTDTTTVRKQIKDAISAAGFSYPSMVNGGDDKTVRLIFEFEAIRST
ncbi:MAG: hypothetical protein ABFC31_07125 [Clostridiaceae bacterium]